MLYGEMQESYINKQYLEKTKQTDLIVGNAALNIKKLQARLKHHVLTSGFNSEIDTVGNAYHSKYIDILEGKPVEIHIIGDEVPISRNEEEDPDKTMRKQKGLI